jgi:hypothetical protein
MEKRSSLFYRSAKEECFSALQNFAGSKTLPHENKLECLPLSITFARGLQL